MFQKFFQQYLSIFLIFLIAIVGTLGFTFILRPALGAYQIASSQRGDFEQAVQKANARDKELQDLKTQLQRLSASELEKLNYFFVSPPELVYLLSAIKSRAQSARFLLTSMEISAVSSEKDTKGPLQNVAVQAQLKGGGYSELKEFLRLMSRATPLMDISSFTYDPSSTSLSLNLKAYRIKDNLESKANILVDTSFFADPRFSALSEPVVLPDIAPVGKDDPFTALTPESQELEIR